MQTIDNDGFGSLAWTREILKKEIDKERSQLSIYQELSEELKTTILNIREIAIKRGDLELLAEADQGWHAYYVGMKKSHEALEKNREVSNENN